mgnify:FL=1
MDTQKLLSEIQRKKSYLCIGLDSDFDKLPTHLKKEKDPIFAFNKAIVDETHDTAVAYKINTAFYEALGSQGWESLYQTAHYIKKQHPDIFLIADAKRGDIGNTAKMYAKAFFEQMPFDAVTVAPYMGRDSIDPFLGFPGKWVIVLGLTSNQGAYDFQFFYSEQENQFLFEKVISTTCSWSTEDNMMFVFGATKVEELKNIRKIIPNHFLLVPGIGAQGGSLEDVSAHGLNQQCGLLINSSRSIIFGDSSEQFSATARRKAKELQEKMSSLLKENHII